VLKRFLAACLILLACLGPSARAQTGVDLAAAEYFVGADPGEGRGIPIALADTGVVGWRTLSQLEASLAANGTVQKYSVRFKTTSGVWSNPLVRSVLIHPAGAPLHSAGAVPVERSMELQSTMRTVAGVETTALVPAATAGATENFRSLSVLPGLSVGDPGVQSYGLRGRVVGEDWGNAVRGSVVVRGTPASLQSTLAEAARAEVRFGVDNAGFAAQGRISITLGGQTVSQAANGESKATTLSRLLRQIQENAALATVYAVSVSGEVFTVKLLSKREFEGGEVLAGAALVESGRTASQDPSPTTFELSQPDGAGGAVSKAVASETAFAGASFLPETLWTLANFGAAVPFSVRAKTAGGVASNPLLRQVLGYSNNFGLQATLPAGNPPSVSFAVDEAVLSPGSRPGLILGGTLVDVAWGGSGTASELILSGLVARVRSDPALSVKYAVEVAAGTLVVRAMSERAWDAGEIGTLRALKQVGASTPVPRGITELEYATTDPTAPGTVFTKIPVQISNAGFLSAGSLDVVFQQVNGLAPIFTRAVSSDGTRSEVLSRTAVVSGGGMQIHPAVAAAQGPALTLSLNAAALNNVTRPGFLLGGILVDASWTSAGGSTDALLANLAGQIRANAVLSGKYTVSVSDGKLVLRAVVARAWDASEVSDLRAMAVETTEAFVDSAVFELEYATSDPSLPGTVFTKIPAVAANSGFLAAGSLDVSLAASGGLGSVYARAVARDGTRSLSLVRTAIVSGGGLQIHPATAAANGPSVTLAIDEAALSNSVRPGFKLGGTLVDTAWAGAGTPVSTLLEALASRIRSDAALSAVYSANVVNGSLQVSGVKSAPWGTGEISDPRAMRVIESRAPSSTAVVEIEVGVGSDGTLGGSFVKVPVNLSGDGFLTAGALDVQIPAGAGVRTVGVRAGASGGVKSQLLTRNILVSGTGFELQATAGESNGSAALFAIDPALKTGDTVEIKLGSERIRVLRSSGMSVADVLARMVGMVRNAASLAQNYAVRVEGGALLVETVAARAWEAGELEATAKATLQITKTRVSELELETFSGADPGPGQGSRLTGLGDQLGGFARRENVDVALQSVAGVQGYGVRARNKGGEWSNTLARNVLVFGAGFQRQPTKALSGAAVVELLPGPEFGLSSVRLEVLGTVLELVPRDGESKAALLQRIADAVNGSKWIQGAWRAQVGGGGLLMSTLSSRAVADGEVRGDPNLAVKMLERGRAEEDRRGIAKIQVAEIGKESVPMREIVPTGISPFMTAGELSIGSLQLPPGVRRFAVRAIGTGGELGNWTLGKVAVMRFTSPADNVPPTLTLLGAANMELEVGTAFIDPGWQATDSASGNLNGAVTVEGAVDSARPGLYTLRYQVLDDAGNVATASRAVRVKDSAAPQFSGLDDAVIGKGTQFDPWATVSVGDPVDGNLTALARIVAGSVNTAVAGSYTLTYRVSDAAGNQTEIVRKVQVLNEPVVFGTQPKSVTANPGARVSFNVEARGPGTVSYQWRKNGMPILGATGSVYTVASLTEFDEAAYDVMVGSSIGSIASAQATLSVNDPVVLTGQPASAVVKLGEEVSFGVTATGTAPITYQWRKGGVAILGATSQVLKLTGVKSLDAGTYDVVIGNVVGSVISRGATLGVNVPVEITAQPSAVVVNPGAPITLSVSATGTGPLAYQWRKAGVPISGATLTTVTIASATSSDAGLYDVIVSNVVGSAQSAQANVSVNTALVFTTVPDAGTIKVGDTVTLRSLAVGTGPVRYQWRKDGVPIEGATNPDLTITGVTAAASGSYDVVATNPVGSFPSRAAFLAVRVPVSIAVQPESVVLNPGGRLSLMVRASGSGPLSYQWRKGGVVIAGATAETFSVSAVQVSDSGNYDVMVSNSLGTLTSDAASVRVNLPVLIEKQPQSVAALMGQDFALSVHATGKGPLTYQWRKDGVTIVGANGDKYQVTSAQVSDSGDYDVVVSNIVGSTASATAKVLIQNPLKIVTQPVGRVIDVGQDIDLSVVASSAGDISYQWRKDGISISGATRTSYSLKSAKVSDAGNYDVLVSGGANTVASTVATVTVNGPVEIKKQPNSLVLPLGGSGEITVQIVGAGPLQYQWSKGGTIISGGTGATLKIDFVREQDYGVYAVSISNGSGSVTSMPVTVSAPKALGISAQPVGGTLNPGGAIMLGVTASGSAPFFYQWRRDGVEIQGATGSKLSLANVSSAQSGSYDVLVRDTFGGSVRSTTAVITVNAALKILSNPLGASLLAGEGTVLRVNAVGMSPIRYQWSRDGKVLTGATQSELVLESVSEMDAGIYEVLVSGPSGSLKSVPAEVRVTVPPSIVRPPSGASAVEGSVLKLSVSAKGTGPLSYQWFKDNVLIEGAVGDVLLLGKVAVAQAGAYRVVVTGGGRQVVSPDAEVKVVPNVSGRGIVITRQPEDVTFLKGSATVLPVSLNLLAPEEGRTTFELYVRDGAQFRRTGISGLVGGSGNFNVPLKGLSTGDYFVEFKRELFDGTAHSATSRDFRLNTRTWDEVAGNYEGMLLDSGSLAGDPAKYRGMVAVTVSKTGAVSGRIAYNEAVALLDGGSAASRAYIPVTRRFTGSLTSSPGQALKLQAAPKLGVGLQALRQEAQLEIDFSGDQPTLVATVTDLVSKSDAGVCVSSTERCFRIPSQLPAELAGVSGRYTLSSDQSEGSLYAQIFLQVLPSGKSLWTSRMKEGGGSGSASLDSVKVGVPQLSFYEARSLSSSSVLSTSSLLGHISFERLSDNSWEARVGRSAFDTALECQSTLIGKAAPGSGGTAAFQFDASKHRSRVSAVDFGSLDGCRWADSASTKLPSFILVNTPITLSLRGAAAAAESSGHSWTVTISSAGVARVTGNLGVGGMPPTLSLRVDRSRGQLTGSFVKAGVRSSLYGAFIRSDENLLRVGRGWMESVDATTQGLIWTMEYAP
jgi:hypothetical protein